MQRVLGNSPKQIIHRQVLQGRLNRNATGYQPTRLKHTTSMYDGPIVISGISGRFSNAENMDKLKENLLGGVDMVREQTRWVADRIPRRAGFMENLDKFDNDFFTIPPKMAAVMEPAHRILLEVTYEALVDAGINPQELRNSNTGVWVGASADDAGEHQLRTVDLSAADGYSALSKPTFLMANRVSYTFSFNGPSMSVNTGCSSSIVALEAAVNAMRSGQCDAAIVAGVGLHCSPRLYLEMVALGAIGQDGACKMFDHRANGYIRGEAIGAILIQKSPEAKRCYAAVEAARSNHDGFKTLGISYPSGAAQVQLYKTLLEGAGIEANQVKYVEAHGTGTPVGDPQEAQGLYNTYCADDKNPRSQPLLVGSVKTSVGHSESAAGIAGIAKIAIMSQTGIIPGNLHFEKLNPALEPYVDRGNNSLRVVTENSKFEGGVVGVNSFGLGGTNAAALLSTPTTLKTVAQEPKIPMLLPMSGRTEDGVRASLGDAAEKFKEAKTGDFAALMHNVFQRHIPGNNFRGYWLGTTPSVTKVTNIEGEVDRPVWMVFPGMGCQWNEMGKDMMKLDVFAESMNKSKVTLKNLGIDLEELLKPNNPAIFDNIRNAFVSIGAVQVALYDTLMSLQLKPQGFIGHSAGEALCAYADGCLSHEETLQVMEARGRAFIETLHEPLAMASVGMSWSEIASKCPPDVYPACNNSPSNVSVAGSVSAIKTLVSQLKSQGVFVQEVNSCNTAPHTPYIKEGGELYHRYLSEIFSDQRLRSSKWISTSVPQGEWDTAEAKYCSAEYFRNNMLNQVLFHEATQKIPEHALVVEVAPRGLLQAALRESAPSSSVHFAPMNNKAEDKIQHFVTTVGDMYTAGVDVQMDALYPKVSFPVAADTPFLGPLVRWNHEMTWKNNSIVTYPMSDGKTETIDIREPKNWFIQGHKLDDRLVFPATGYLVMVWKHVASRLGLYHESMPIVFSSLRFMRATFLSESAPSELTVSILDGANSFLVSEEGNLVMTGDFKVPSGPEEQAAITHPLEAFQRISANLDKKAVVMNKADIYKEYRLRGYNFSGDFCSIDRADVECTQAELNSTGNWTTILDSLFQTTILGSTMRNTLVPVGLEQVAIDPQKVLKYIAEAGSADKSTEVKLPAFHDSMMDVAACPGLKVQGLTLSTVPRARTRENLAFETHDFKPYFGAVYQESEQNLAVNHLIDLVLENSATKNVAYLEMLTKSEDSLLKDVRGAIEFKPGHAIKPTLMTLQSEASKLKEMFVNTADELNILVQDKLEAPSKSTFNLVYTNDWKTLQQLPRGKGAFAIVKCSSDQSLDLPTGATQISSVFVGQDRLDLVKLDTTLRTPLDIRSISVDCENFSWLPLLQEEISKMNSRPDADRENSRIYLTSQGNAESGILGLVKCLRLESGGDKIRCIFDPDRQLSLDFAAPDATLMSVLQRDLVMSVVKENQIGMYVHEPVYSNDQRRLTTKTSNAYVGTLTTGDLASLAWIESPLKHVDLPVLPYEERCTVAFASVNPSDVLLATGRLPMKDASKSERACVMGSEFSGYDSNGNRVMGLTNGKAMATSVLAHKGFLAPVPDSWSLEEAATVPLAYTVAFYALCARGRLGQGQSVLIHCGSSSVGQAAISVALSRGCDVFTTVETPEQRASVLRLFPELKAENVGDSGDCDSFERMIKIQTNGKGVDVVFNSLADQKSQLASVRCLGKSGRFLEVGNIVGGAQESSLDMSLFSKNAQFHDINLDLLFEEPIEMMQELGGYFFEGIANGAVRPLQRRMFEVGQIEDAFRYIEESENKDNKVLIKIRQEEVQEPRLPFEIEAIPSTYCHPQKSYMIIGGLGGLGLEVGNFLVERGARRLVLPSRSGATNGYQAYRLQKWSEAGVVVETPKVDLSNVEACEKFMFELTSLGGCRLGGIFNSSLVLRDAVLENQTVEAFHEVAAPKVSLTQHLDRLTRKLVPDLEYFVTFSSGAAGRGNIGQINYGYANSAMERICEERAKDGLHGLAVQWGVIGEVGVVAEKAKLVDISGTFGATTPQSVRSCLDVLDAALQQKRPVCSSMILADKDDAGLSDNISASLTQKVLRIFGIKDASTMPGATKLSELGVDSLTAVELRQTFEREHGLRLTTTAIRSLTFKDIKDIEDGTFAGSNK